MTGRFKPRPTRFDRLDEVNGWRLKRYEITVGDDPIPQVVSDSLDVVLAGHLPEPDADDVGVGFLIVHYGADSVWALADLWAGDIIHQHTFSPTRGTVAMSMDLMSDEPTYRASTGDGPGTDYVGRDQVRVGFAAVIEAEAASGVPALPVSDIHVFDNRGMLFWSYAALSPSGEEAMVEGVDVWTFDDGRIAMKDAYRKAFFD